MWRDVDAWDTHEYLASTGCASILTESCKCDPDDWYKLFELLHLVLPRYLGLSGRNEGRTRLGVRDWEMLGWEILGWREASDKRHDWSAPGLWWPGSHILSFLPGMRLRCIRYQSPAHTIVGGREVFHHSAIASLAQLLHSVWFPGWLRDAVIMAQSKAERMLAAFQGIAPKLSIGDLWWLVCCWQWYWVGKRNYDPLRCVQSDAEQEWHQLPKASISDALALVDESISVALTVVHGPVSPQWLFLCDQVGRTPGCHHKYCRSYDGREDWGSIPP